ncbi:PD40 domain-containing protein [Candidatus Bathyarchaeota archaeon]|nr:PD40 domain-containing protein [Candidatus Bathyarchaeota archaeon]
MMEPGLKRLTSSPGKDVGAVYSPEGGRIVWVTDSLGNWTIWIMNEDGAGKQQLTPSNVISGGPSWSPDGREIAYWSWDPESKTCDIWKMTSDGSSRVKLTTDGSFKGPPMWSPRGDRIAYTANQTGNMEVYIMNIDGTGNRQLTRGHNPGYWVESRTTWHPDGVHLYYQVTTFPLPPLTVPEIKDDVAYVEIYMLNVDTGKERNLTPRLHENVRSVSRDGRMACISLRSPNYGLWIMNEDGTGQQRLTWNGKGDRAPRITPDGRKIVYWSLTSGNPDIWMINSDGANNTQLTRSPYMDAYPTWSPDGKKIAFESDRAGSFDIWVLSLDQPLTVNVEFETCAPRGGTGKALLTIRLRDSGLPVRIEKAEIRFAWESEGKYAEFPGSLQKLLNESSDVYQQSLEFAVPQNAELGYSFYDVRIQYSKLQGGTDLVGVYEYSAGDLEVGIPEHARCDRLCLELGGKLQQLHGRAINRSFALGSTTSEVAVPLKGYFDYLLEKHAESFLRANDEFHEGRSLYRSGDYAAALLHFQRVKTIMDQTAQDETMQPRPPAFPSLAAPLLAALALMLLVVHVTRSRRKL